MSKNTGVSKRKQSIIAGALISSAGVFFAKFIGLLYAVPFNSMLMTPDNIAYFGVSSNIFAYFVSVCQAGFPFAVATLVARYAAKGDIKTTVLIRKLSNRLMLLLGFVMMLILILFSRPLAQWLLPTDNVEKFQMTLILTSFALLLVPVLSTMRGFYQGLKEMDFYALSQVLEQLANVAFLLIASAIAIYMFNSDRVWAAYFGVIGTSVGALLAILHFRFYDRKKMKETRQQMAAQSVPAKTDKKAIYKELIYVAAPFLIIAAFGYSDMIINTLFLNKGLESFGNTSAEISLISGSINYGVLKLMSIPMVLAPGFSSAIIPHITSAIAAQNFKLVRKNIRECVDIVLYIAIPISFCLYVFAKPIYANLFPPADPKNLDLLANITEWFAVVALLNTLSPIVTNLLMAVGLRRISVRNMIIQVILKFATSYFLLQQFGFIGIVISAILAMSVSLGLGFYYLTKECQVHWKYTFHKLLIILLGCLLLWAVAKGCFMIGLIGYDCGRLLGILQLGTAGLLSVGAYFIFTYIFQLPQTILHFNLQKLFRKFGRRA